jgi:hypothetical protein
MSDDAREREHGAARARRSVSWGEWARTLRPRKLARARLVPALLANRAPLRPVLAGEPLAVVAVRPLAVWAAVGARRVAAAAAAVAEGLGVHGQDVVPCEKKASTKGGTRRQLRRGAGMAWSVLPAVFLEVVARSPAERCMVETGLPTWCMGSGSSASMKRLVLRRLREPLGLFCRSLAGPDDMPSDATIEGTSAQRGRGREGWVELVRQRVVYGMIARWGRLSDRDAGCRHAAAGTCWAQACARLQPRILTTLRKAAGGGRPLEATHGTSSDGARVCKGRANGRGAAARRCTGQATMCRLQAGKQSEGQAGAYRREAAAAAAGSGSRGSRTGAPEAPRWRHRPRGARSGRRASATGRGSPCETLCGASRFLADGEAPYRPSCAGGPPPPRGIGESDAPPISAEHSQNT